MVGGLRAFRVKVGEDAPGFHRVGGAGGWKK